MTKKAARRPTARRRGQAAARGAAPAASPAAASRWTFLTNHSHVLILLSQDPSLVLREVAARVGITERAVQRIIADLEEAGFIEREKVGRRNHYRIRTNRPLRHPIEAHRTIGDLVGLI
jgi:predicted transcriptional regulator